MAIAEHLARRLKEEGYGTRPVTGAAQGDWVLVDAGDVIVHVFRPEVRDYYDLEGMWTLASRADSDALTMWRSAARGGTASPGKV